MELVDISQLRHIERIDVDPDRVRGFDDEGAFTSLAVRLLGEAGARLSVAANALREERPYWTRDEAIVGGHVVRLHKLISGVLQHTCDGRRELAVVFVRPVFECGVNLCYMLKNPRREVFDSFVRCSLTHEKQLMERILASVRERGGKAKPIEERMLRSIKRSFDLAGVDSAAVDARGSRRWGAGTIYDRAKDLGWQDPYLGGVAGPSHNVHGSWQDIMDYHVQVDERGRFAPDSRWHAARPQYITACCLTATQCGIRYLAWFAPERTRQLRDDFRDLQNRVLTTDRLHEGFMCRETGPA
jgi:hypothetical protein